MLKLTPANTKDLPETEYYFGDPCYVIPDDLWDEFVDAMFHEAHDMEDGVFRADIGDDCFLLVISGTAYGDGCYPLYQKNDYGTYEAASLPVDSGTLSAIPMRMLGRLHGLEDIEPGFGLDSGFVAKGGGKYRKGKNRGNWSLGRHRVQTY
jgi:hypothetical protein